MAEKTATRKAEGTQGEPGQGTEKNHLKSTTMWGTRQALKIALPFIATVVTSTKFTGRKSLFLDRLLTTAEGGRHDI